MSNIEKKLKTKLFFRLTFAQIFGKEIHYIFMNHQYLTIFKNKGYALMDVKQRAISQK